MLDRAVSAGRYPGHSPEILDGIRRTYEPLMTRAAEDYVAELDGAMQAIWETDSLLSWMDGEPNPGNGPEAATKPLYVRSSRIGPWSFRAVVRREDHPSLHAAHNRMKELSDALLAEQLSYLKTFDKGGF